MLTAVLNLNNTVKLFYDKLNYGCHSIRLKLTGGLSTVSYEGRRYTKEWIKYLSTIKKNALKTKHIIYSYTQLTYSLTSQTNQKLKKLMTIKKTRILKRFTNFECKKN